MQCSVVLAESGHICMTWKHTQHSIHMGQAQASAAACGSWLVEKSKRVGQVAHIRSSRQSIPVCALGCLTS
jgi:hypothetical protein